MHNFTRPLRRQSLPGLEALSGYVGSLAVAGPRHFRCERNIGTPIVHLSGGFRCGFEALVAKVACNKRISATARKTVWYENKYIDHPEYSISSLQRFNSP